MMLGAHGDLNVVTNDTRPSAARCHRAGIRVGEDREAKGGGVAPAWAQSADAGGARLADIVGRSSIGVEPIYSPRWYSDRRASRRQDKHKRPPRPH